jgi:hypothetical protein
MLFGIMRQVEDDRLSCLAPGTRRASGCAPAEQYNDSPAFPACCFAMATETRSVDSVGISRVFKIQGPSAPEDHIP